MTMLTKAKLDRRWCVFPEVSIQEALEEKIKKDALPKGTQETLLSNFKELFIP